MKNDNTSIARAGSKVPVARAECEAPLYVPRSDIYEKADGLLLLADMPGVPESSVDIELDKDHMTITGRLGPESLEGYDLTYSEYRPGGYRRTFRLSDEIDVEKITASMKNGTLAVHLPKKETVKPRKITVQRL